MDGRTLLYIFSAGIVTAEHSNSMYDFSYSTTWDEMGRGLLRNARWDRPARTLPRGDYFFIMFFALKFEWCETIFAFVYILVIRNSKHLN